MVFWAGFCVPVTVGEAFGRVRCPCRCLLSPCLCGECSLPGCAAEGLSSTLQPSSSLGCVGACPISLASCLPWAASYPRAPSRGDHTGKRGDSRVTELQAGSLKLEAQKSSMDRNNGIARRVAPGSGVSGVSGFCPARGPCGPVPVLSTVPLGWSPACVRSEACAASVLLCCL